MRTDPLGAVSDGKPHCFIIIAGLIQHGVTGDHSFLIIVQEERYAAFRSKLCSSVSKPIYSIKYNIRHLLQIYI
jgi:hypothetical protein